MRVLVDECLPKALTKTLPGHDARTVAQMGWDGIENGALLTLAQDQFDVFITGDRNLSFQQKIGSFKIGVLVLRCSGTRMQDLSGVLPRLAAACAATKPGTIEFLDG